jgi:hypothetical protein
MRDANIEREQLSGAKRPPLALGIDLHGTVEHVDRDRAGRAMLTQATIRANSDEGYAQRAILDQGSSDASRCLGELVAKQPNLVRERE